MRFLACLAISSRNMLHSDRLRSPMWWRYSGGNLIISGLFLNILSTSDTVTKVVLPLQDRARVYRTWSVCIAEGSRRSGDFGKEAPNTAETSFQMHGCRNWRISSIIQGSWPIKQHCSVFYIQNVKFGVSYQKIERSEVSTSISTKESTIFVWKIMVFIILPSSLWSAKPRLAFETLV